MGPNEMWPFRRRHKPEEAPTVKEAIAVRDELFNELETAIGEVDRVQERVIADYEAAEHNNLSRRRRGHA